MPKSGFKSITISAEVYDRFYNAYKKNREELKMKGVNSFAGYVTLMLDKSVKD
jgi:hypothetical protein